MSTDRPDTIFRRAKLQWIELLDADADAFFVAFLGACDVPGVTSETPMSEIEHDSEAVRLVRRASYIAAEEVRLSRQMKSRP